MDIRTLTRKLRDESEDEAERILVAMLREAYDDGIADAGIYASRLASNDPPPGIGFHVEEFMKLCSMDDKPPWRRRVT